MRRGRGEGSIRRRAPNRYEARFVGTDGRRHSLYARSRPEAVAKLTSALRDLNLGIFVTGERQTVAQYLDTWLTDAARTRKPRTMQRYAQLVRQHAAPIGAIELRRLTPQHIAGLYAALAAEGPSLVLDERAVAPTNPSAALSPSSIAQLHAVLHGALEQAVRWNLIPRNPAAAVKGPKVTKPDITPLTAEQVRTLLAAVQGDPLEALYILAVTTGMRSGELLGLQWQDIDLGEEHGIHGSIPGAPGQLHSHHNTPSLVGSHRVEDGSLAGGDRLSRGIRDDRGGEVPHRHARVQVRRTLYWMQGWQLGTPKTAASVRSIALTESAVSALRAHRRRQAEELLGISIRIGPESQVFTDRWGNPINGFHLSERIWKPLCRRLDLPVVTFHTLRHTCATLHLAAGTNPKIVQEMLGHSSVKTTLDLYSHTTPNMQEEAAQKMDRMLRGAG